MRLRLRAIVAACALGLTSQVAGTLSVDQQEAIDQLDSCPGHLNALVMFLEETAQIEGTEMTVEWRDDGTVVLWYEDFSQHMWCQDGELHIDCRDPGLGDLGE